MNNTSTIHTKRFLAFSLVSIVLTILTPLQARAGALLTKTRQAETGNLVESETALSLQSQYGAVEYKKDQLLWYSTAAEVDTLFKAGQKAMADGNRDAAQALFESSATKESATANQARGELDAIKAARAQPAAAAGPAGSATASATDLLSPEDKIKRGNEMIQHGTEMQSKPHLEFKSGGGSGLGGSSTSASTAAQVIADGKALVAQGEKELKAVLAKKAAEEAAAKAAQQAAQAALQAKKQEMQQAKQALEKVSDPTKWEPEDKKVYGGVGIAFALIVVGSLWQITMKEPVGEK